MDPAQLEAIAIAGTVASLLQERFLNALAGRYAFAATVVIALACGTLAVSRTGIVIGAHPADTLAFAIEVVKVAAAVLAASQAAYFVLTRPVAAKP